jgi:hypothetical protein
MQEQEDPTLQRLEYATPMPPRTDGWGLQDVWIVGRRVLFALGCGMLVYGLCDTYRGGRDGLFSAGWGASFIGLTMPWPRRSV